MYIIRIRIASDFGYSEGMQSSCFDTIQGELSLTLLSQCFNQLTTWLELALPLHHEAGEELLGGLQAHSAQLPSALSCAGNPLPVSGLLDC